VVRSANGQDTKNGKAAGMAKIYGSRWKIDGTQLGHYCSQLSTIPIFLS